MEEASRRLPDALSLRDREDRCSFTSCKMSETPDFFWLRSEIEKIAALSPEPRNGLFAAAFCVAPAATDPFFGGVACDHFVQDSLFARTRAQDASQSLDVFARRA